MKTVLITGIGRSGLTKTASRVGAHPQVAVTDEQYRWPIHVGVLWSGNKMPIGSIDFHRRASKFGYLMNRIEWLGSTRQYIRSFPIGHFCIDDVDKIIVVRRDLDDIFNSMVKRGNIPERFAEKKIDIELQMLCDLENNYDNVLTVRYEDDGLDVCTRVVKFLDIAPGYEALMADSDQLNDRYGTGYR